MKVVALLSGGKDSIYNLHHCIANHHEVIAIATLIPPPATDELDSWMYQSVATNLVALMAQAMGIPYYERVIRGTAVDVSGVYGDRKRGGEGSGVEGDETEDLYELLKTVKLAHPDLTALSSGAILSTYQRLRTEHVASRLSLTCLCYLWQRPEANLVDEMLASGMECTLVKVAGIGLEEKDVGKGLGEMRAKLGVLEAKYQSHVAGEGGEYETTTTNAPMFHSVITHDEKETLLIDPSPVALLRITSASLHPKPAFHPPTVDELRALLGVGESGREGMSLIDRASEELLEELGEEEGEVVEGLEGLELGEEEVEEKVEGRVRFGKRGRWFGVVLESVPLEGESIEDETRRLFSNLKETLLQDSLTLLQIQHQNLLLSTISLFPLINPPYSSFFGSSPPSRACVAVPLPAGQRVRLEAVGYDDSGLEAWDMRGRRGLHVQSVSHWAPANIGPYSQAIIAGHKLSIAGQIGLIPPTLLLPSPQSFTTEALLSLQHVRRIVEVLRSSGTAGGGWGGWMEGMVCWFVGQGDLERGRRMWELFAERNDCEKTPVLFVQASELPKNALVEWQAAYHTGKRVAPITEAEDEDGEEEVDCKFEIRGESKGSVRRGVLGLLTPQGRIEGMETCRSALGRSGFSIRFYAEEGKLTNDLQHDHQLAQDLAGCYSLRLFYVNKLGAAARRIVDEIEQKPMGTVVSLVPAHSLADRNGAKASFALVIMT